MIVKLHSLTKMEGLNDEEVEDKLDELNLGKKQLKHMIDKTKEEVRDLTVQFQVYNTKRSNLLLTFERIHARKQDAFWWIIIVSAPLMVLHSYAHEVPLFCLFNGYAFLVNWKALYQKEVPWAKLIAFLIIAATIKFV